MTARRPLALAAVLVGALLVETTVLARMRLAGVRPDVLVLVVVAVATASGPTAGAAFGFATGLLADLLFGLPAGVTAAVYTAVGFAVGSARVYVAGEHPAVHLGLALAASMASAWAAGLLLRVFDLASWGLVARAGPLVACCNLPLAPVVQPAVRALLRRAPAVPDRW